MVRATSNVVVDLVGRPTYNVLWIITEGVKIVGLLRPKSYNFADILAKISNYVAFSCAASLLSRQKAGKLRMSLECCEHGASDCRWHRILGAECLNFNDYIWGHYWRSIDE